MERVPPEVWDTIFAHLLNYKDLISASKVCTTWRNILQSTRQLWLFGEAFPLIVKYLSEQEIFLCRLVCQHWCQGVECFLENNACPHPPAEEPQHHHNLSLLAPNFFRPNGLKCHGGSEKPSGKQKMLLEASEHARNPLLGRALKINERENCIPREELRNLHLQFLRTFGHHIWFVDMEVYPREEDLVETFKRILEMLMLVPNLKKLCFTKRTENKEGEQNLSMYMSKNWTNREKEGLPKMVETLLLNDSSKLSECLFTLLANDSLRALHISNTFFLPPRLDLAPNLADIYVHDQFDQLQFIDGRLPLQSIQIVLRDGSKLVSFFRFVNSFQTSLRRLDFVYMPFCGTRSVVHELFADCGVLKGCHQLKKVTLCIYHPLQLNFLCGLAKSLEYLYIFIDVDVLFDLTFMNEKNCGSLDLLKYIKMTFLDGWTNRRLLYRSNVWRIFSKLRLLAVHYKWRGDHFRTYEYRRHVYDKLNNSG